MNFKNYKQIEIKVRAPYEYKINDIRLSIPLDVKFFYDIDEVGPGLTKGCIHYNTIVNKNDHEEWLKLIEDKYFININEIGDWCLISLCNVKECNELPVTDREQYFKNIGFKPDNYIFVEYDSNLLVTSIKRLVYLKSSWCLRYQSINKNKINDSLSFIEDVWGDFTDLKRWSISTDYVTRVFSGEEGKMIWCSALNKVLDTLGYDVTCCDSSTARTLIYEKTLQLYDLMSLDKSNIKYII